MIYDLLLVNNIHEQLCDFISMMKAHQTILMDQSMLKHFNLCGQLCEVWIFESILLFKMPTPSPCQHLHCIK